MRTLHDHARDWDELAEHEAFWAILSEPGKEGGGWDVGEFFATGEPEMARVVARAEAFGYPRRWATALDFGCGVGRVTRAMSRHFERCVGVDVSPIMVESARRLNREVTGCEFIVNDRADLALFDDAEFDFIYCSIVLQHLPSARLIEGYLRELVRVLHPNGLLVFQLPTYMPWRYRLQPRRRAYALLRRMGVPAEQLQSRLGLYPIRMTALSETRVQRTLGETHARVLDVERSLIAPFGIPSGTYLVTGAGNSHALLSTQ